MNTATDTQKLPPMLTQYLEYKRQYPDCHLLFQVGDFYELFFEDAVAVAKIINLTLTTRDKNDPNPVPMCGFPIAVVEGYIERLVSRGHSVAVVSQVGAPTGKGMVERRLERIVTPGVRLLGRGENLENSAVVASCIVESEREVALAFSDVQSGVIHVREGLSLSELIPEVLRSSAIELILPRTVAGKSVDRRLNWVKDLSKLLSESGVKFRPDSYADSANLKDRSLSSISGYAALSNAGKRAIRMLVSYVDETTIDARISINEIAVRSSDRVLVLDSNTRNNLELVKNSRDGGQQGTLLEHLDLTVTIAGARLLRNWILNPLSEVPAIQTRQEAIRKLVDGIESRLQILELLKFSADAERVAARIELGVAGPRELSVLRTTLEIAPLLIAHLGTLVGANDSQRSLLSGLMEQLSFDDQPLRIIQQQLADSPPVSVDDGGCIKQGFDAELDSFRALRSNGKAWMLELEIAEKERTGINSLKLKFNNVLGFYIEVTKANSGKVPENYIRRQSTINSERFTTVELRQREQDYLSAEAKLLQRERYLFEGLRNALLPSLSIFRQLAKALAQIDVLQALAEVAVRYDYTMPTVDDSFDVEIKGGKHPVLGKSLAHQFVPNDVEMFSESRRCLIITGPNMGGKSTYIRQLGLIVILAQIGSYVPAKMARIGIVDRVFARIGASDNMAEGDSTFMVEMRETANIVSAAQRRSLLLVDEIGRGTATTDGLVIAQSILEWIIERLNCRAVFATHFHELTQLESQFAAVCNLSVGSVDRDDDVVFTHQICVGAANKSYGIEVAKLAGLPSEIVNRAKDLMVELVESKTQSSGAQLGLFGKAIVKEVVREPHDYSALQAIRKQIQGIDINQTTPLEALSLLAKLKTAI